LKALEDGAPPASVHYNLALVHLARDDVPAALASALRALDHDQTHAGASALASRLRARLAASPAPRTRTTNDER
ncbi:MAG: hypothetical protein HYS12_02300, partial [Planctomycetes bacterium]|nr:hypothetical protein [Planctomycetota bacterium]